MADEPVTAAPVDAALRPFPPGGITRLVCGSLRVDVAAGAGGRIARISHEGDDWLVGYGRANAAMIAWGCYPMLPWAGRIRRGRFAFAGARYQLPSNLEGHAIHGFAFALPWRIDGGEAHRIDLSLQRPRAGYGPVGCLARQRIELTGNTLHCRLSLQAQGQAMPRPVLGWHPWFIKPDAVEFHPQALYPRDGDGIATRPVIAPAQGPWDDCFINHAPVVVHRNARRVRLTSDCSHWVVYDQPAHATCVEPQTGPPDAFNLEPAALGPDECIEAWFSMAWE